MAVVQNLYPDEHPKGLKAKDKIIGGSPSSVSTHSLPGAFKPRMGIRLLPSVKAALADGEAEKTSMALGKKQSFYVYRHYCF